MLRARLDALLKQQRALDLATARLDEALERFQSARPQLVLTGYDAAMLRTLRTALAARLDAPLVEIHATSTLETTSSAREALNAARRADAVVLLVPPGGELDRAGEALVQAMKKGVGALILVVSEDAPASSAQASSLFERLGEASTSLTGQLMASMYGAPKQTDVSATQRLAELTDAPAFSLSVRAAVMGEEAASATLSTIVGILQNSALRLASARHMSALLQAIQLQQAALPIACANAQGEASTQRAEGLREDISAELMRLHVQRLVIEHIAAQLDAHARLMHPTPTAPLTAQAIAAALGELSWRCDAADEAAALESLRSAIKSCLSAWVSAALTRDQRGLTEALEGSITARASIRSHAPKLLGQTLDAFAAQHAAHVMTRVAHEQASAPSSVDEACEAITAQLTEQIQLAAREAAQRASGMFSFKSSRDARVLEELPIIAAITLQSSPEALCEPLIAALNAHLTRHHAEVARVHAEEIDALVEELRFRARRIRQRVEQLERHPTLRPHVSARQALGAHHEALAQAFLDAERQLLQTIHTLSAPPPAHDEVRT